MQLIIVFGTENQRKKIKTVLSRYNVLEPHILTYTQKDRKKEHRVEYWASHTILKPNQTKARRLDVTSRISKKIYVHLVQLADPS